MDDFEEPGNLSHGFDNNSNYQLINTPEKFGRILRRGRILKGLTMPEMADKLGSDSSYIWKLEAGWELPSNEVCELIAEILSMAPRTLTHVSEYLMNQNEISACPTIPEYWLATPQERFRALIKRLYQSVAENELTMDEMQEIVDNWRVGLKVTTRYFGPASGPIEPSK